jgi:WD40 repeat protein
MDSLIKDEKIKYFNTDCSPSHLLSNISISDKNILYIHNSEIQPRIIIIDKKLLTMKGAIDTNDLPTYVTKLNSSETNEMLVAKYVCLSGVYMVAVGLYGGFKLWSNDGNRLLFQIPCKVKNAEKPYCFTAICEYRANPKTDCWDSLIAADNYGQIFLISGSGQNWRAKLLYSHDGVTITSLVCSLKSDLICVAFESGEIFLFLIKNDNLVEVQAKLDSLLNLPCLKLSVLESDGCSLLLAGYLNGEIKIWNISQEQKPLYQLTHSIAAHKRLLTDITCYKNYFLSSGDDCFVNLWKYYEGEILIVGNFELPDKMPVGVGFEIKDKRNNFVDIIACCYDFTSMVLIDNVSI